MPEAKVATVINVGLPPPPPPKYILSVEVVDYISDAPIEGATVKANSTLLTERGSGIYDGTLPEGTYILKAEMSGYLTASSTVTLDTSKAIIIRLVPRTEIKIPWILLGLATLIGIPLALLYRRWKK